MEPGKDAEDCSQDDDGPRDIVSEDLSQESGGKKDKEEEEDFFFFLNYKNGEFFLDSLFMMSTMYERHGDGLGCFILSKILPTIFHGCHHSNYSCSVHWFINRVLAEASLRDALKIIHEIFQQGRKTRKERFQIQKNEV